MRTSILVFCCVAGFAQMNVGEIGGVVTDPAGGTMPGTTVSATNIATGTITRGEAGAQGIYLFAELTPGTYTVTANAAGFRQAVQENIALHAGEKVDLNFSLESGERTETLMVEEFPGMLQTESAQIQDVIENQQVLICP